MSVQIPTQLRIGGDLTEQQFADLHATALSDLKDSHGSVSWFDDEGFHVEANPRLLVLGIDMLKMNGGRFQATEGYLEENDVPYYRVRSAHRGYPSMVRVYRPSIWGEPQDFLSDESDDLDGGLYIGEEQARSLVESVIDQLDDDDVVDRAIRQIFDARERLPDATVDGENPRSIYEEKMPFKLVSEADV